MAQTKGAVRSNRPISHAGLHRRGLRAVASFEFLKGLIVLLVGFGLIALVHRDVGEIADNIVYTLHIDPDRHLANVFIDAAYRVTDTKLWAVAAGAFAYTAIRFAEAYGLWHARIWAEWFALVSGSLYLPWEIYELLRRATAIRWIVLLVNAAIVLYMAYVRVSVFENRKDENTQQP